MSAEKATGPCNKFQPNIFNKSKCQNCFKSREVHLLNDSDMEQAKPIYAGWLCLAPVGTDFENPMQRSRKWQRRFFILYEHGSLSYALDELRSTLPQGTVNMNLCTDITDAEPRTGQKNALCIINPTQEIFIRGDNKETINGWNEQLAVYLQTNKQNQKKKRKVEPVANQEPSPAKMAATDQSCPPSQGDVADCGQRQEEQRAGGPDVTPVWTVTSTDHPGSEWTPAGSTPSYLCPVSRGSLTSDGAGHFGSSASSPDLSAAGRNTNAGFDNQLTESANVETASNSQNQRQHRSSADQPLGLEAARKEHQDGKDVCRQGRTESRTSKQESQQSKEHRDQLRAPLHQRRAKSLDRRTSDTVITPDLLNFKKGWMMKLDEKDQWRKYWFVLSTDSLRYYKDSVAEEASVLEGEIDLTKCYNASEYQVQRNYGFQIHTLKGIFTLSAMTAGIRKNWIQALMKNVHPANAPDVASLPGHHIPCSPPEAIPKPDVTQDSTFKDIATERDPHSKSRNVTERRQEGRYKTFDWAEFRTRGVDTELPAGKPLSPLELGDLERRRRREERRRRYESMLGISLGRGETQKTEDGGTRALSPKSHQRRKEEIEECWRKVEKTVFIPERTVLLCAEVKDTSEAEKLLHGYRKVVEELKVQLAESERRRLKLEERISTNEFYQRQLDLPLSSEAVFFPAEMNEKQLRDLKDLYKEPRELFLQQQVVGPHIQEHLKASSSAPQLPSIWLHDTEDRLQELSDLPPETAATLSAKPASNSQNETSQVDGQVMGLNFKGTTTHHLNHLDREDCQMFPTSNTMNDRDDSTLTHVAPDQSLVRRLSQEVEVLTRQNQALNQRNQEMINQLTEADREIERLKMELSSKFAESHLRPEVELQEKVTLEDLERQLSMRNQELLDAQMLIASLQESLSETEALLQLKGAEGTEVSGEDESKKSAETEERRLLHCLKATETKLMEVEKQVERSELTCRQLEQQNTELNVALKLYLQRAAEAEADLRRLKEELEKERLKQEPNRSFSGEEKIQQVIEGMVTRLRTLEKLLEVTDRFDFVEETEKEEGSPDVVRQLRWEEEFWKSLLNKLKDDPSQLQDPVGVLVSKATECMMLERQILLEGHSLLLHTGEPRESGKEMCESKASKEMDLILNNESVTAPDTTKVEENCVFAFNKHLCGIEHLKVFTRTKITLLNQISSSIGASANDKLLLTADRLYDLYFSQHPWSVSFIYFTATEALYCFVYSRLLSRYERGLCCSCVSLKDENQELKAKLSALYEERSLSFGAQVSTCCQTDESYHQDSDSELQSTGGRSVGDVLEDVTESENSEMETPLIRETKISEKHFEESEEEDSNMETQQVSDLTAKVKELEERLSVSTDEMKEEFDEKMSSVQQQHEKEVEKLKATCECGLTAMEECHLKVVEELQRRHQQEVERLLVERDRLLEEESAATATAIEAIKNAHHVELQTEIQRRCQSENSNGNTQLEEIHQQHRAELASCQRELDVLSQQFSLKCLEIKHLVQALDAERKALCLCQQENQDLRSRNQELSGHLAAEITRLCSMAKQDALPLSQGMDMYEMEITLRVKESEVQCLKQEITSLKDKLQTVVKDQRNAAKLYKDVSAELHVVRGKAERDADELREKLRLAYQALNQTLP